MGVRVGWKSVNCPSNFISLSICSALALFSWGKDRARTRLGEIKHRISARKVEGVFYPCLIYVSYSLYLFCAAVRPGKFQEAWGGVGVMLLSQAG